MNSLYMTSNVELVKKLSKDYAKQNNLEWYGFQNNREDMNNILYLYENNDDCVIFLEGLTKSIVSNSLLKVLEEVKKNIHMYATSSTYDMNRALTSRFIVCYLDCADNEAKDFIKTKKATKEQYSKLSFYIDLAKLVVENKTYMQHNLALINNIIKNIRLTTTNTPWDYQYGRLKNNFRW